MSTSTFGIIIMILGFLTIAMTLVAAYFAAMWKDEQRKNQMLMKNKLKYDGQVETTISCLKWLSLV